MIIITVVLCLSLDIAKPWCYISLILSSVSAVTFSRFIPSAKCLFDYGAMIFILTFSFVAVSGYRVDKLFDLAHQRLSTIIIGTSLCILVIMLVCPIWSGQELHSLIVRNMDKLADSLDGSYLVLFSSAILVHNISSLYFNST